MKNWIYNEDLLIYIWQLQKFDHSNLKTTDDQTIIIQNKGFRNNDSGPDFEAAKLIIEGIHWAGTIEMHWFASDWDLHNHEINKAYDNVILHVVYEEDKIILNKFGKKIPCLSLKNRIPSHIINNSSNLNPDNWIPCEKIIHTIDDFTWSLWLDRLLIERIEEKSVWINNLLQNTQWNWEECFYILISKYFGGTINSLPFEKLAMQTPYNIILKNKADIFVLESILFGQSGLLIEKEIPDNYTLKLLKEYNHFKSKYKLKPIENHEWKFLRLRPASFPTIRIAELAAIIHKNGSIFRKIIESDSLQSIYKIFDIKLSDYWDHHYIFNVPSKTIKKKIGKQEINTLIINAIVPFLYVYGRQIGNEALVTKSFDLLNSISTEKNSIIKKWQELGITCKNASHSQALIQLNKKYCQNKKCLSCSIGHSILSSS